eukprot:3339237-Pleurochrysis_carterae.AAC.1
MVSSCVTNGTVRQSLVRRNPARVNKRGKCALPSLKYHEAQACGLIESEYGCEGQRIEKLLQCSTLTKYCGLSSTDMNATCSSLRTAQLPRIIA